MLWSKFEKWTKSTVSLIISEICLIRVISGSGSFWFWFVQVKGLLGGYKTPFKLCFLRFSLWDITEKIIYIFYICFSLNCEVMFLMKNFGV